jgi:endonuclease III
MPRILRGSGRLRSSTDWLLNPVPSKIYERRERVPLMTRHSTKLQSIVARLERHYGPPSQPPSTDPFELILWEQVGYLVDDERRAKAFNLLRKRVGVTPEKILAAPEKTLLEITKAGGTIAAPARAKRLRDAAVLVLTEFDGDLRKALREPFAKARKALAQFPSIGEPGAEKILLFTCTHPVLALDSNGLRVFVRLGYVPEQKNYRATYRAVRAALQGELKQDCSWLIRAHQLLRRHGQELCKRSSPVCHTCPLMEVCAYFRSTVS